MKNYCYTIFGFYLLFLQTSIFAQTWQTSLQRADSLFHKREFKLAIPLYQQLLPQIEKDSTQMSQVYLGSRNRLGRCMMSAAKKDSTVTFLMEQLALCKKFGATTKEYGTILHYIGTFYMPSSTGNVPQKAIQYLEEAISVRKKVLGELHLDYAESLNNLATVSWALGNYTKAESLYLQSLQIKKELLGEKHIEYAGLLVSLASLYQNWGQYQKAEGLYHQSLKIYKDVVGEKHPSYNNNLMGLAIFHQVYGNYAKAEDLYITILQNYKETIGEKHLNYAKVLNNLGHLYITMGNYAKAKTLHLQALTIRKELLGEKHLEYAQSLNNLGIVYFYLKDYQMAQPLFEQSIAINSVVLGKKTVNYATALTSLAVLYQNSGAYHLAKELYVEVVQIYGDNLGKKHPFYGNALHNLASLWLEIGNYPMAEKLYTETFTLRKEILHEKHYDYLKSINSLSIIHQLQDQLHKALPYYLHSVNSSQSLVVQNFSFLSEKEKTDYYNSILKKSFDYFSTFATTQNNLTGEFYNLQLFSKGLLLNSTQKMKSRILNSKDTVLIRQFTNWNNLKLSLAKYYQMSQQELRNTGLLLDSLEMLANDMEKSLYRKSESFTQLTDKQTVNWQDVQKKLRRHEAAIEIVRVNKFGVAKIVTDTTDLGYKDSLKTFPRYTIYGLTDTVYYAALIVTKKSKQPEMVILTNGNDLEGKSYKQYYNAAFYKAIDHKSYETFWQPIKEKLGKKIRKVYFSPDGVYHQINLNILKNPQTRQYVLEEIEIQQVTNTRDLLSLQASKSLSKESVAVLVGRPTYRIDSVAYLVNVPIQQTSNDNYALRSLQNLQQSSFTDLKGTEIEINLIDSLLQTQQIRTQKYLHIQATEEKIKSVQSPTILHIATHGFFIDEGNESNKKNPMLSSGILLAGVSNYFKSTIKPDTEDGVLTAQEVQNLVLDNTDLVVLSACETAKGEIMYGEGVYGLQRALKVAGAKSILMSHWKVDDTATQELMTLFYTYWIQLKDKRKAFLKAQQDLRLKYPNPYYWGAFVLVGE
jgi:CHAT domain-containing protein